MKFDEIRAHLDGVPFIGKDKARRLYDHLIKHNATSCLELGFAHGASSCYIAAAIDEMGGGSLTTVDIERAREWFGEPSIEDLLERTGLGDHVEVVREKLSYTWFLQKQVAQHTKDGVCRPVYDFCYIDGAHNWTVDGLAFFLVDKLLKEDGWVLFDDLGWSYATTGAASVAKVEECGIHVSAMDEDERTTPHVGKVFDLLVKQHPCYGDFIVQDGDWGWARKSQDPSRTLTAVDVRSTPKRKRSLARRAAGRLKRKLVG
jgi:predicted O-methyltransferase YrrM